MNLQEDDQELIPTRESLLERLRKWDDHEAWRRFFDTYWRLIYRAAVTAGLRSQDAEEVVQETVVAVARHMPQFTYRPADEGGSFKSWLLNQTKWRIRDVLKKKLKTKFDVSLDIYAESPTEVEASEQVLAGNSIDQLWEAQWEETLLAAALNQLRQEVDP